MRRSSKDARLKPVIGEERRASGHQAAARCTHVHHCLAGLARLPCRNIRDHRHGRWEIVLQHFVGIGAGLVTARPRRPFDLVVVLPGAHLHDVADVRQWIGQGARGHQQRAGGHVGMDADVEHLWAGHGELVEIGAHHDAAAERALVGIEHEALRRVGVAGEDLLRQVVGDLRADPHGVGREPIIVPAVLQRRVDLDDAAGARIPFSARR
jgi:hypothetical protein